MRRGTTPTITVELEDYSLESVDRVLVTIRQDFYEINKESEVVIENETATASVTLTQEETLGLRHGKCAIQIKFLSGDIVAATDIAEVDVEQILNEEVMTNEDESEG